MRGLKVICCLLVSVLFLNSFCGIEVQADSGKLGIPTFKVKRINGGTGVKITVNKTKGADGYQIYATRRANKDSNYLNQNGEFTDNDFSILKYTNDAYGIAADGTKKRSYTIKGLPKGKYTFKVVAYKLDTNSLSIAETSEGEEKSITIKAVKSSPRAEKKYDFSSVKVGDIIEFGAYEQDDDMRNGKEPIEWIVLSKEDDHIYLLSRYILDKLPYDKSTFMMKEFNDEDGYYAYPELQNVEWASSLDWLNDVFYKEAFTQNERKMIGKRTFAYTEYNDDDT